jgi:phytoene dehydrogenase-like protein
VLVVGQGFRPATYAYDGMTLARRAFTFHAGSSPAWGRIVLELAQSQTFRRRLLPRDPTLQILAPDLRFDVPSEPVPFAREIDREFPAVRRVVDELYADLARTNAAADAAFERDVVWPPGTFWERRETGRFASALPHLDNAGDPFLAELPRDHAYRTIVDVSARFASHSCALPSLALARLHGAWTHAPVSLARGEDELHEFLLERVRAHGGETLLADRASAITHRGGRVTGVVVDGDEEPTGVQFVVADLPMHAVLDLAIGYAPNRRAIAALPRLAAGEQRFVVSILVRDEGIPEPLASESFLLPSLAAADLARPTVHLQRLTPGSSGMNMPSGMSTTSGMKGMTLLVAEALLPVGGHPKASVAREAVLRTVERFLPFVERHYVVVDSVHDGRPLWDYRSGARRAVDRSQFRASGASLDAEPMALKWNVDPQSFYGLGGEPVRAPLAGAYLAGRTTLPALGQEGELLSAWSAARLITRTDGRKEKMRREMWNKVELG